LCTDPSCAVISWQQIDPPSTTIHQREAVIGFDCCVIHQLFVIIPDGDMCWFSKPHAAPPAPSRERLAVRVTQSTPMSVATAIANTTSLTTEGQFFSLLYLSWVTVIACEIDVHSHVSHGLHNLDIIAVAKVYKNSVLNLLFLVNANVYLLMNYTCILLRARDLCYF